MEEIKKRPYCPRCGKEMSLNKFIGYYDSFLFWDCDSCAFEDWQHDDVVRGDYA